MVQVEPCPLRTETTCPLPEAKNTQREPQRPQRSESVGRGVACLLLPPPAGHLGIILHWHVAS